MSEKLHYYAFSFNFSDGISHGYACAYMGYPEQLVSVPRINEAKQAAGVPKGESAVLVGLSYMGYMTKEEVTTLS